MEDEEPGGAPEVGPKMIEHAKFEKVVTAKRGLEAKVVGLEEQVQMLSERAAGVDTLTGKLREAEQRASKAEQRFSRYSQISSAIGSTDTDVIDAFEWQHSRLPEEGRPELADWLKGMTKEPEKAPSVLRPFLAASKPSDNPADTGKRRPREVPGAGHEQPPEAPSRYSREELQRITNEAVASGDWSTWERIRGHR